MLSCEKIRKEYATLNLKRESYKLHQEVHEQWFSDMCTVRKECTLTHF